MKQKHQCWRLKLLHHHPHSQQSPHSPLKEEEGVDKREDGGGEVGKEEIEQLSSLKSVFDCSYIKIKTVNDGKNAWECGWCGKSVAPRHASRAL
jgi:hypothetical protein